MRPITKFAAGVRRPSASPHDLHGRARMLRRRAGAGLSRNSPAMFLDREIDIAKAVIPQPGHYRASTKSIGDPGDIEKLADILAKAERPAILLGSQVWTTRGHEPALACVRALDIPADFNGAGRGLLPPGDPHHFDRTRSYAFDKADVIVIVGTPFDFRMGYGRRLGRTAKVVQIDSDYRTVGKNRDIELGLVGDPGTIRACASRNSAQGSRSPWPMVKSGRSPNRGYVSCRGSLRAR